ncbi:MAG: hypothetical protein ASARMPREDX12_003607 [Alectoria sarmentosa]|nr:MAG: hypothetical protein ASARMPREDX12_003607 [Alectoria sarmentosa]
MDWNSTKTDGPRVSLAIAKLPSKVPVTDPRYGGLLWLQIGGPGASGIEFLRKHGKTIQMIVDSDLDPLGPHHDYPPLKYFDIIGIDARGVNNTTPRLSCFPSPVSRDLWMLQSSAEGMIGSSEVAFSNIWARAEALGRGCSARVRESENEEEKLAFHMNTTPIIADMTAILELHGKWRDEQARKWMTSHQSFLTEVQRSEIIERTRWKENQEKLLFWGFSYGTVIGATFAAMQPHRIERAVMDGVVDSPDYYRGEWLANLQDTDEIMKKMCDYCDRAGPGGCALYTQGGASAIMKKFDEILESIRELPIGVPASGALAPDLITYSDVKWAVRGAVYAPIQEFSTLAKVLTDLSHRNGTSFAAVKQQQQRPSVPTPECRDAPPYAQECQVPSVTLGEATTAILCSDGNSTSGMTRSAFASYVKQLQGQSQLMGDSWAQIRMGCIAWDVKPKWRYPGPFAGITAKPMLLVGTTKDPVTPIRK